MMDSRSTGYVHRGRKSVPYGGPLLAGSPGVGLVGVVLVFAAASFFDFWPLVFVLWWVVPFFLIPALGFSARGLARLLEGRSSPLPDVSDDRKERELLGALERHGEITAARAALETSLSVSEADRVLGELAKQGHIEVRAREGRLGYALWDYDRRELTG